MSLLAKLLAESEAVPPATPATPATQAPKSRRVAKVASPAVADTAVIRGRLLVLAEAEYRDAELVRALGEAFLRECNGFSDAQLGALLSMLADDAERKAGRAPPGETAAILCRRCGPVYAPPSVAAVLPMVDGWPRALGCPWCFVRLPEGHHIPRPHVTCHACQHYRPDAINPDAGMGRCGAGMQGVTWPHQSRACAAFKPKEATP